MFCTGKLNFKENGQMIAIDKNAIIFDKNKYFVMVFHSKKNIETREVEIHTQTDKVAFISSGLAAGEKLITKNQLYVYDALND
jgi:cobalt-zinc-cadmium efflux system membrane fusion protein